MKMEIGNVKRPCASSLLILVLTYKFHPYNRHLIHSRGSHRVDFIIYSYFGGNGKIEMKMRNEMGLLVD